MSELPENFGKVDFKKIKQTLNLKKHMKFKKLLEWITEEDKHESKDNPSKSN